MILVQYAKGANVLYLNGLSGNYVGSALPFPLPLPGVVPAGLPPRGTHITKTV